MHYLAEISNWGVLLLIWWIVSMFLGKKKKKLQKSGEVQPSPPGDSDVFDFFKTIKENLPVSESFGKPTEIINEEVIHQEDEINIEPPKTFVDDIKEEETIDSRAEVSYTNVIKKTNTYRKILTKKDDIRKAIILKEILGKPKAMRGRIYR